MVGGKKLNRRGFFSIVDIPVMLMKRLRMAARRKTTPNVKLKRLEAQTQAIRTFNRVLLAVMGLALGLLVVGLALPQRRDLADLQERLAETLEREKAILIEKEYRETEYRALKEDLAFMELKAMDRLNLRPSGQKVYRIKRGEH
ncbi:MAG: hypothetical protein EAZ65_05435 [Verrucomicrobia bacterium]|nr:MAG: hypothetical protein EAZ84_00980 [Verrucomicrobiota bacterium]TAE87877.1 MAG: hypothetical protein EAZ82_06590 [Verrucomicrobiota bacterium]TAF25620.1 MAG: hypothetical protein EAZ71_07515 [Verrucomicrobiota bacterium]TAF41314.1 MAG: hypothetical protein EAZ65_05435 [Verrucomicrobiota bacterium]